ncbi:MAG: hypothetical protein H7039_21825 [Bryobacteraceae bacterium]|nr:hypothetical protein [Bryobacteraceae bacterium]
MIVRKANGHELAADTFGSSRDRLERAYELDAEIRRDLPPMFAKNLGVPCRSQRCHWARDSAAADHGPAGEH